MIGQERKGRSRGESAVAENARKDEDLESTRDSRNSGCWGGGGEALVMHFRGERVQQCGKHTESYSKERRITRL
jgi:hypothetical protein